MCGRYTLRTPPHVVAELFDLVGPLDYPLRYNIAPSQQVLAVRQNRESGQREPAWLAWGLIPFWAKDPTIANRLINARSESAAEKPAFREAFKQRRCLIPSDGFYEWQKSGKQKQPYLITLAGDEPYAYAGLWERWQSPAGPLETCTILTTEANDKLASLHNRMPVILDRHDFAEWLDPGRDPASLQHLFEPFPASRMRVRQVSSLVNSPRHEGPACLNPPAEPPAAALKPPAQRNLFD